MKWVILIGDNGFEINTLREIEFPKSKKVIDRDPQCFTVEYEHGYVCFERDDDIIQDYDEKELHNIPFTTPHFIVMRYSMEQLMINILKLDDFPKDILIDDDNIKWGILPVDIFLNKIK